MIQSLLISFRLCRSSVQTGDKVEFDSLSRSTLSSSSSSTACCGRCCRQRRTCSTRSTLSNSTLSPVCTGPNSASVQCVRGLTAPLFSGFNVKYLIDILISSPSSGLSYRMRYIAVFTDLAIWDNIHNCSFFVGLC